MDHSTAIMQDAGNAIDGKRKEEQKTPVNTLSREDGGAEPRSKNAESEGGRTNNYNQRKRKANFQDASMHHGSRGRGRGRGDNKRHQKNDMGRGQYFRQQSDKRQKTQDAHSKRNDGTAKCYGKEFSKEEIDAEGRRPKRKVAVLIGYSGTGYKGMQISPSEKTIEGDLFNAFIAAGAIAKANADDPKKASLVRCARTDKGVHAAGNMISLKLIVEDDDIVEKINEKLSPQIRVWGIERTIGSFSCYQACDSRWYEYLIPSHAFLPPHPSSWLAKKMEQYADETGDRDAYEARQAEVKGIWERVDEEDIKSVLDSIDEDIRYDVIKALQGEDEADAKVTKEDAEEEQVVKAGDSLDLTEEDAPVPEPEKTEDAAIIINEPEMEQNDKQNKAVEPETGVGNDDNLSSADTSVEEADDNAVFILVNGAEPADTAVEEAVDDTVSTIAEGAEHATKIADADLTQMSMSSEEYERQQRLRAATKRLRNAYNVAKRRYRIPAERVDRIQEALSKYVGTCNYHNFTVQKTFKDPSAKRHIKSFVVNRTPILIGSGADADKSEWLSLKVHGQSFMMHQIRKMIGMVTLLVRCGCDLRTLNDALTSSRYSIPKVPGLGLLLERPVFDSYNNIQATQHDRPKLDFGKFNEELEAFKQREIYQRIFREEEERNDFAKFFNHIDNFKDGSFLFVTSKGLQATEGLRKDA